MDEEKQFHLVVTGPYPRGLRGKANRPRAAASFGTWLMLDAAILSVYLESEIGHPHVQLCSIRDHIPGRVLLPVLPEEKQKHTKTIGETGTSNHIHCDLTQRI